MHAPSADLENASMIPSKDETRDVQKIRNSEFTDDECFYNLCDKTTTCWGRVPWGKFKNRNNAIFCSVFGLMCFALLLAVIVPLVSPSSSPSPLR